MIIVHDHTWSTTSCNCQNLYFFLNISYWVLRMIIVHDHTWSIDHTCLITSEPPIINLINLIATACLKTRGHRQVPRIDQGCQRGWKDHQLQVATVKTFTFLFQPYRNKLLMFVQLCHQYYEDASKRLHCPRKGRTACLLRVADARYCSSMCTGVFSLSYLTKV